MPQPFRRYRQIVYTVIILYAVCMIGGLLALNMNGRLDANGNVVRKVTAQ